MIHSNGWPTREQTWLLQACLLSGLPASQAWKQWTCHVDLDRVDPASFKLLPLVSRNTSLSSLDDPIFEKCKGIYRRTWVENKLLWKKTAPVLAQLLALGVGKIVLLKGMAMILHYYRDFGVRVIGDIDLLIEKEKIPMADRFFKTGGWEQNVWSRLDLKNPDHLKRWHALNFTHKMGMNLDLHWSCLQENSCALDASVLEGSQLLPLADLSLYIPNPTDLFLQTCVHGVKHSAVPLIRWIADAVTIVQTEEINWERLVELAHRAHMCLPLFHALEYLRESFHTPIPSWAIEQLKQIPLIKLESLEYRAHSQGHPYRAAWYRYCLNQGYRKRFSQWLRLPQYLKLTARLKSPWAIPFFAVYWLAKRMLRALRGTVFGGCD